MIDAGGAAFGSSFDLCLRRNLHHRRTSNSVETTTVRHSLQFATSPNAYYFRFRVTTKPGMPVAWALKRHR